jgi:membrane-associated phospholipid phosphatase
MRGGQLRTFVLYALPFVGVGVGYSLLGRFAGLRPAHVSDVRALEQRLFPVRIGKEVRALSEVIASHPNIVLDVLCGLTYFLFLPEVFGFAFFLFFRSQRRMLELSVGFLLVNLVGWTIWVLYPVAPPWYADLHPSVGRIFDAPANAAALERVDALLGVPYFRSFYARSAYVFGALPSLHVAYAVLVARVTWALGGGLRVLTSAFAVVIAFAAVYLRHHYILDVLAGAVLGVLVAAVVSRRPVGERSWELAT